jgi:hypothetical protein
MIEKVSRTWWARIYLSGPLDVIEHTCRKDCLDEGLCVTVSPVNFIYTGGEERGAVVGLINYPRFPSEPKAIEDRAKHLALRLLEDACQHSVLVQTPTDTYWITKRKDSKEG